MLNTISLDIFFPKHRNSIGCAVFCIEDRECGAFMWDQSKLKCTLVAKSGLCLDKHNTDPMRVFVEEINAPKPCTGILK